MLVQYMKKFAVAIMLCFFLAACANRVYDKAIEDAKLALAGGEIDKEYGLYEVSLSSETSDFITWWKVS